MFVFGGSTRISLLSNWLNNDYPCQGDTIIFEETKKTVTFIDESIQVSSILLPQVGAIIFSDDSVLGEKSSWQCAHRKSSESVFFQAATVFPGFSDPSSWSLDDTPLLHMNMVPGAKDDVVFHDMGAFQVSIDDQVTVNTMKVSRDWPMTTQSFTHFVRTMEGQFQVSLGHTLAKESSEDNVSRMLPIKDPIVILSKERSGDYNPNMENKTLTLICNYVQCFSTSGNCTTTVRPLGHCCDVCAGLLTFASDRFNVHSITELVDGVVKENALDGLVQYSIERIDEDGDEELIPRYQIAIFQTGTYDETLSRIIITKLNQKFISKRTNGMEYVSAEYEWSITDHSYAMGSKVAGLITFCILILVAAAVFWRNVEERERLRAFFFANTSSSFRVVWRQGKNDDDVVQLVDPDDDQISEEEDPCSTPSLLAIRPNSTLLQTSSNAALPESFEGLASMEMKLIE